MFINDLFLLLSEIFLLLVILYLIIYFVILDKIFKNVNNLNIIIFSGIVCLLFNLIIFFNNFTINYYILNYLFYSNFLISSLKILVTMFLIVFFLIFISNKNNVNYLVFEYFLIIFLIYLGILCLLSSLDFLSFYVSLELISLGLYIIASFNKFSNSSVESGIKYFILGAISSGILLLGVLIIYGLTGFTNFLDLSQLSLFLFNKSSNFFSKGILLGFVLIIISLLFKLAIAPFHSWVPDVYKGSPLSSVAFFSIIPKIGIIGIICNIYLNNLDIIFLLINQKLLIFVLFSWLIGSVFALYQIDIKRLLAYSSVTNMSFILLSIILFSVKGIFYYKIIYLLLLINIFSILLSLENKYRKEINNIFEYINLYKSNSILSLNFIILLFSLLGVPPLMGFFGKWYVFTMAFVWDQYFFVIFIGLVISVLSSFYYLKIIKILIIESKIYFSNIRINNWLSLYLISISFYINLIFFINPTLLLFIVEWYFIV